MSHGDAPGQRRTNFEGSDKAVATAIMTTLTQPASTAFRQRSDAMRREAHVQQRLVRSLLDPACYPHPVSGVTLLETHGSYVLLTGHVAYKIKKAVNLGFLDFSSLDRRRFYCEEELALNRRLAGELYEAVVPICGTPEVPVLGNGNGKCPDRPFEYAVRMREFPQEALLDRRLAAGALTSDEVDTLADRIAAFHVSCPRSTAGSDHGNPERIWQPAAENFAQLRASTKGVFDLVLLDVLERWSRNEYARQRIFMAERQRDGFIRECHGDLHLGNIALVDAMPVPFDCIEFSANLRWIDVINEIAFLFVDLDLHGRPDLAWRLLNRYLEHTGDHAGLRLLPFYCVYRALVRAKIAAIRAAQGDPEQAKSLAATRTRHLVAARRASLARRPLLVVMHGVSGSGKTWLSQAILERIGAIRLRSDIERKRLHGLSPCTREAPEAGAALYDSKTTIATYQHLMQLALPLLQAGLPVIIDATCLKGWQRMLFSGLADTLRIPLCIVSCTADTATLEQRVVARRLAGADASDADIAVLRHQLQHREPLDAAAAARTLTFSSGHDSLAAFLDRVDRLVPP